MDNIDQINEIKKYKEYLSRIVDKDIDMNTVANIWIRKYARLWRLKHPHNSIHSINKKIILESHPL